MVKISSLCKTFFGILILKGSVLTASDTAQKESDLVPRAETFVQETGQRFINVLKKSQTPMDHRKENFRRVLEEKFDMHAIAKFVLAAGWRSLDKEQRDQYVAAFIDATVENYASHFKDYNDETLEVQKGVLSKDGGVLVHSSINRQTQEPLRVDWKVFHTKKGMRILDIIVNGVSMSITLRTEYVGVFADKGGYDGLMAYLANKKAPNPVAE